MGCSADAGSDVQAGWTPGTEGRLQFSFELGDVEATDALSPGTAVDVRVAGPGADGAIEVASRDDAVATFDVQRLCSCTSELDGSYTIRSVASRDACQAAEVKRCKNLVSAFAHSVGDTELVVLDAEGAVLDRTPVKVREQR